MATYRKLFVLFLTSRPRRIIDAWRQDYNTVRSHSASGYLTPEEF
jgi:transposase InsO family protein